MLKQLPRVSNLPTKMRYITNVLLPLLHNLQMQLSLTVIDVLLLPVDDLVPLLLQRRDDGGVGHGGGVAEILVVGRNLAEDAPHDLSRTSLWQGRGVLQTCIKS